MKLYLSSYHIGDKPDKLRSMIGNNKKVALITNAKDYATDLDRLQKSIEQDCKELESIGLIVDELDLRDYFGKTERLRLKLKEFGVVWVRGGNVFLLRRAMQQSGFDEILKEHKGKTDLVYGGYSAGACVVASNLRGLELVDDAIITPRKYNKEIIWKGLGFTDYTIIPHYRSSHKESEAVENVVKYFQDHKMAYKALRDGEVIIAEY